MVNKPALINSLIKDMFEVRLEENGEGVITEVSDVNNRFDAVENYINERFRVFSSEKSELKIKYCTIDFVRLYRALFKYSRDIYHVKRIKDWFDLIDRHVGGDSCRHCRDILVSTVKNNGYAVETDEPALSKQLSYLFFWLCKVKPFSYIDNDSESAYVRRFALTFNEFISYNIVSSIAELDSCTLDIKNNGRLLENMLHRNITRSSLEAIFDKCLVPMSN
jgi:hypothetical protein